MSNKIYVNKVLFIVKSCITLTGPSPLPIKKDKKKANSERILSKRKWIIIPGFQSNIKIVS